MKLKNGFTLIELLAVIIVLSIVSIIAVPIILNVIDDARKESMMINALNYVDAVEKQIMFNELNGISITDGTYTVLDLKNDYEIELDKSMPTDESWVKIVDKKVVDYLLVISNYVFTHDIDSNLPVIKEDIENDKEEIVDKNTSDDKQLGADVEAEIVLTNDILVYNDGRFMPDKYNTGIDKSKNLITYDLETMSAINGVNIVESTTSANSVTYVVALISGYKNTKLSGEYIIENYDFSNYYVRFLAVDKLQDNVKFIFKNCKFGNINTAELIENGVSFVFENSEIGHFSGSNATFNNCKFGQWSGDAINPFQNVTVRNSYFSDLALFSEHEVHLDGVQIFARANIPASNIHFYNTRFETPYTRPCIDGVCSNSSVNAPIMLQLEYNNGDDISFEKVYVNGGGYSIYTHAVNGTSYSNVLFKDVYVGGGKLYGNIYPDITEEGLTMENIVDTDSLLIGSVWKDSNGVHISTTNDTLVERVLTCQTDKGNYTFNMSAHPKLTKENCNDYSFETMPYDIDNVIENDVNWIKCYDTTNNVEMNESNLLMEYNF